VNWIQTVEPTIPISGGIIRPIRTYAPRGTFMNAEFPAAMGNRWVAVMRVYDAILGCLNQAVPGGIAAAGAGQAGIISVASTDPANGRRHVSVVEPFIGGSGARVSGDGVDGIDQPVGFLKSAPIEVVELETPLVIRRFGLEPASPGPGRFRGGHAMRMEIENRDVGTVMTVRGMERFRFQPWGLAGGGCGAHASCVLNPGCNDECNIGRIDVLELRPGNVLRMITPSGGGYGDPFERDRQRVLQEVLDGLLTVEQARAIYGVVVIGGELDLHATAALRRAESARCVCLFSYGPTREALETIWPPPVSAALATGVQDAPATVRTHLVTAVREMLGNRGWAVTEAEVRETLRMLQQ
jgi:N-methylhydantoinase B